MSCGRATRRVTPPPACRRSPHASGGRRPWRRSVSPAGRWWAPAAAGGTGRSPFAGRRSRRSELLERLGPAAAFAVELRSPAGPHGNPMAHGLARFALIAGTALTVAVGEGPECAVARQVHPQGTFRLVNPPVSD